MGSSWRALEDVSGAGPGMHRAHTQLFMRLQMCSPRLCVCTLVNIEVRSHSLGDGALSSLMLPLHRNGSRALRKTFLGCKTCKRL